MEAVINVTQYLEEIDGWKNTTQGTFAQFLAKKLLCCLCLSPMRRALSEWIFLPSSHSFTTQKIRAMRRRKPCRALWCWLKNETPWRNFRTVCAQNMDHPGLPSSSSTCNSVKRYVCCIEGKTRLWFVARSANPPYFGLRVCCGWNKKVFLATVTPV